MSKSFWLTRHNILRKNGQSGSMSTAIDERMLAFFDAIRANIKPIKCESIADFGCSVGKLTDFLIGFFNAKKYIGYDIIDFVVEDNRKRFPHALFTLAKNPIEKADVIWCSFLLQHLNDKIFKSTLERFKKALKPGGRIYIVNAVIKGTDDENMFYRDEVKHKKLFAECKLKSTVVFRTLCGGSSVSCFEVTK